MADSAMELISECEHLRARVAELEAALEPFAEVADDFDADGILMNMETPVYANTAGDFYRARAALNKQEPSDG